MTSPLDAGIAARNARQRADHAAESRRAAAPQPDLSRALVGERVDEHRGGDQHKKWADELWNVCQQAQTIRKNPLRNAAQLEVDVADLVRGRRDRLLAECDERGKALDAEERTMEQKIDSAYSPPRPEWNALGAEYRAVMRTMPEEQRQAFVERLQGSREMDVLRYAIASVPPELSGVSFGMHQQMRDTLLAVKDPALLTQPGKLKESRAALKRAKDGIRRTADELVDLDKAEAIKALAGDGAP